MCVLIVTVNATATETPSFPTPVCEVTALTWGVMRWDQVINGFKLICACVNKQGVFNVLALLHIGFYTTH